MAVFKKIVNKLFHLFDRDLSIGKGSFPDSRTFLACGWKIDIVKNRAIRVGTTLLPSGGYTSIGNKNTLNQYVVINGEDRLIIGRDAMVVALSPL